MATFLRTNSASSLSSVGSDNTDVAGKAGLTGKVNPEQVKARNIMQRTRDALGDIGNRLKKNPAAPPGGKVALKKPATTAGQFAVPSHRPPRVAVVKPIANAKSNLKSKSTIEKGNTDGIDASVENLIANKTVSSPKVPETVYKLDVDVKSGNYEQIVPFQEKENVPLKPEESEPEVENEYNPKLSTENAVVEVETFTSERLNIINIDVDEWNPLLVQVYINDIYDYVFALEKKYPIRIRYLEGRHINSRMRAVLIDWLIEVHLQFGFMPETLYMTTKILDRYLQTDRNLTRKQLQLAGATAMYLAAKYEEVCTPAVQDFAAVSDNAFTVADLIKMEQEMLKTLNFDLAFPPAVLFLRRFSKAASANMANHSMAKYIMELSLVDYTGCHLFPSEQAAGALALSLLIVENKSLADVWTPTIEHYSRYSADLIKPIISILAGIVARAQDSGHKLKAVTKKYAGKRLNFTSVAPELKVEAWKHRVLSEVMSKPV